MMNRIDLLPLELVETIFGFLEDSTDSVSFALAYPSTLESYLTIIKKVSQSKSSTIINPDVDPYLVRYCKIFRKPLKLEFDQTGIEKFNEWQSVNFLRVESVSISNFFPESYDGVTELDFINYIGITVSQAKCLGEAICGSRIERLFLPRGLTTECLHFLVQGLTSPSNNINNLSIFALEHVDQPSLEHILTAICNSNSKITTLTIKGAPFRSYGLKHILSCLVDSKVIDLHIDGINLTTEFAAALNMTTLTSFHWRFDSADEEAILLLVDAKAKTSVILEGTRHEGISLSEECTSRLLYSLSLTGRNQIQLPGLNLALDRN